MSSSREDPIVTLMSSDDKCFEVAKSVVESNCRSITKDMLEKNAAGATFAIRIPNVKAKTMWPLLDYCKHHAGERDASSPADLQDRLRRFDSKFVTEMDLLLLCRVVIAAYHLDIKKLLKLACDEFAGRVGDWIPDDMMDMLRQLSEFANRDDGDTRPPPLLPCPMPYSVRRFSDLSTECFLTFYPIKPVTLFNN